MISAQFLKGATKSLGSRSSSSFLVKFQDAVKSQPMREAVRYTAKNIKWTAGEVQAFADAHANALLDHGFTTGDTIGIWLKDSPEKQISFLAAAKIGAKVVDIDTNIGTVGEVRDVLKTIKAKALIFDPVTDQQDNLLLLRKSIPEFFEYDDSAGQFFHSKHFPTLKYFIHTGFDIEMGCLNYKSLFLANPVTSEVDAIEPTLSDSTPVYTKVSKGPSGLIYGGEVTHGDLLDNESWGYAKNLIEKKFFEL